MISLAASPVGSTHTIRGHDYRYNEDYEVEAFLPHDLPRSCVDLNPRAWGAVSDAALELGRLDAAAALIPNPTLLTRVATRREAVGTSALEGTYANLTDVFAAEVLPLDEQDTDVPPNVREVMNYARAADWAYAQVHERGIALSLLFDLQAQLVKGTESDATDAGQVRTGQVFIGAKNRRVRDARYVPPPPGDQLRAMFERWHAWLDDDVVERIPLLVRIAMAHYQFEAIHPFMDGNGRLGRLIAVLQLLCGDALRSPVLSVSPWLKDHSAEYRDHLLSISETGEWSPWVEFFAKAVAVQSRDGHDRIMGLLALREAQGDQVRAAVKRGRLAVEIIEETIAYPILTVSSSQARHGRSNQANRDAVYRLVDLGLLEPYGEGSYDRLYWNPAVFRIIED